MKRYFFILLAVVGLLLSAGICEEDKDKWVPPPPTPYGPTPDYSTD